MKRAINSNANQTDNNKTQQQQQQQRQPASTTGTAAIDPGILEMGTSVSVNDEMRRAIISETVEIEAVCTKLAADVNTEDSSAAELQKSKGHADGEVSDLLQGATESMESVHMNEQIFRGLKTTLESEILLVQPPTTATRTTVHTTMPNVVPPSPTSVFAIQKFNVVMKQEITTIGETMGNKAGAVQSHVRRKTETVRNARAVHSKIKADRLVVACANAKHRTRVDEDGMEDQTKHLRALEANRAAVAARNAALRDTLADAVRVHTLSCLSFRRDCAECALSS